MVNVYIKNVEAKLRIAKGRNDRIRKSIESLTELLKASDAELAYLSDMLKEDEFDDGGKSLAIIRKSLYEVSPEIKNDDEEEFERETPVWSDVDGEWYLEIPKGYGYEGGVFHIIPLSEFRSNWTGIYKPSNITLDSPWFVIYENEDGNAEVTGDGSDLEQLKADVMETIGYTEDKE